MNATLPKPLPKTSDTLVVNPSNGSDTVPLYKEFDEVYPAGPNWQDILPQKDAKPSLSQVLSKMTLKPTKDASFLPKPP